MRRALRWRRTLRLDVDDDERRDAHAAADDMRPGQTAQWSPSPVQQPVAEVPLGADVETYRSGSGERADLSVVVEYEVIEILLLADYSPTLPPEQVRRCLVDCIVEFEGASVRTYLPVLIEREARVRLRALLNGRRL